MMLGVFYAGKRLRKLRFLMTDNKHEHGLREEDAAEPLRTLVPLRTSVRADLQVLAPEEIQTTDVRDGRCVRLVGIGSQPIHTG